MSVTASTHRYKYGLINKGAFMQLAIRSYKCVAYIPRVQPLFSLQIGPISRILKGGKLRQLHDPLIFCNKVSDHFNRGPFIRQSEVNIAENVTIVTFPDCAEGKILRCASKKQQWQTIGVLRTL